MPQSQPLSYFSEKCVSSQFIAYLPRQIWLRDEWWSFRILKAIINREHIRESLRNCCNSHQSPSFQALKTKWRWERNREPLGWLLQLPPICIVAGAENQDPMWFTRRRCKVDPPQLAIPHPGDRRMAKHLCTLRETWMREREREELGIMRTGVVGLIRIQRCIVVAMPISYGFVRSEMGNELVKRNTSESIPSSCSPFHLPLSGHLFLFLKLVKKVLSTRKKN